MLRLLGIAADAKARMLHEDAEQLRWRASDVGILVCNESVSPVESWDEGYCWRAACTFVALDVLRGCQGLVCCKGRKS